jgi:hypothetical protein
VKRLIFASLFGIAGCGSGLNYVQTSPAPGPLRAREPNEVEVLTARPARPFVQLGVFEAAQKSAYNKEDAILHKIRKEAGKIGCEAVLIESTVREGTVALKAFRAACLVYTAEQPVASSAPPPQATCTPNETRVCYGPGACQGGQYCMPDGSGFSPCDCGEHGDAGALPPTAH